MSGFNVAQFFDNGTWEYVRRDVPAEEAAEAARHYCSSVGARLGMTVRVIIADDDDYTVFEWKFGEGVTFPPEARGREPRQ